MLKLCRVNHLTFRCLH